MKKNDEKFTISAAAGADKECIDAEKTAEISNPQTGESSFDAESEKNKQAQFEALISGEYKKEFADRVQKIISRRLKEVKNMQKENDANEKIVKKLLEKYNLKEADTDTLERMIDEEMNEKNSAKTDHTELIKRLIAENTYLKTDRQQQLRELSMRAQAQKLREQAEKTKESYPDFELERELKNPEFARLLRVGVSVKNAYEVTNIDRILDKKGKDAEKMVVNSIREKGSRPVENGSDPTGGIILSSDISKLTKKERAELAKRAARGEVISF